MLRRARAGRRLCGFGDQLPHRTTFNRFITRLSHHPELVEESLGAVTNRLRELLPDLGSEVAIDSTTVRTHSNPNRHTVSDTEASWTPKNSASQADNQCQKTRALSKVKANFPQKLCILLVFTPFLRHSARRVV